MLFNADTVDVPARNDHKGLADRNFATEFAEEPDLDKLYNPSLEVYGDSDKDEDELL